ncbi:MAG: hypothetical protein JXQ73_22165 [Phycisphaerae bacterium]|nr:hypothetical protein [Phycisphaerae bacterium]
MCEQDGREPIDDDEILYRRIPVSQGWYDSAKHPPVNSQAFMPTKHDEDGISLWRAKYKTVEEAAQGPSGKGYFVAILRAGDIRREGIQATPTPELAGPGHVSLPDLNYKDRRTDKVLEAARRLATTICRRVEGPFGG